jgi:ABC-type transport system involved in multi-copper enzyme maturation permease subunit
MDSVVTDEPPQLLSIFPLFDISLIFKVVVSILSLLLAYDVISGEREQGTLRLMLSNATSRSQVLLGKMSAGLMTLVLSVTVSFLVGLLILRLFSMVELNRSDCFRVGLIYLVSLIFVSVMFNLGLLISCLCRRSAVSLTLGMFIWLFLAVLLPNASAYLASYLRPIEATHEFDETINMLNEECDKEITKSIKGIKNREGNESYALGAFGRKYLMICDEELKGYKQKRYAITEPIRIKYMKRIREVHEGHFDTCIQQKKLNHRFSQCSPMILYENIVSVLSMTDLGNVQHLNTQVKLYTDEVIEYIRSKTDDFHSFMYFTTCTEQDWDEAVDHFMPYLEAENDADKDRFMEEIKKWYIQKMSNMPSLDLQDFPPFICRPPGIAESLREIMISLGLLVSMSVVFFGMSFVALIKYDIR